MTDNILESNLEIVFTMSYRFFRIWRSETMLRFKLIPDHLKLFTSLSERNQPIFRYE